MRRASSTVPNPYMVAQRYADGLSIHEYEVCSRMVYASSICIPEVVTTLNIPNRDQPHSRPQFSVINLDAENTSAATVGISIELALRDDGDPTRLAFPGLLLQEFSERAKRFCTAPSSKARSTT